MSVKSLAHWTESIRGVTGAQLIRYAELDLAYFITLSHGAAMTLHEELAPIGVVEFVAVGLDRGKGINSRPRWFHDVLLWQKNRRAGELEVSPLSRAGSKGDRNASQRN